MSPVEFAGLAMQVAIRYSASITSWGRTVKRNEAVGGHVESRHLHWLAMDLALDDMSQAMDALLFAKSLGLHGLVEPGCLHLQDRGVKK